MPENTAVNHPDIGADSNTIQNKNKQVSVVMEKVLIVRISFSYKTDMFLQKIDAIFIGITVKRLKKQ